ncbi:MAG TPA: 30S ribosomal protein S16, partial [Acinetobacter pittii]|nr:30S ribosomal protein S16 [Acinetobacter pittii]
MLSMVGAGIIRKNYKAFIMVVIRLARGGAKKRPF